MAEEIKKTEAPVEQQVASKQEEIEDNSKAKKTKKKVIYICSNGAKYNKKEDAEEYQRVLNKDKEIIEVTE